LRELELRITQLKTRGTELQAEQMSTNEMLKLQVSDLSIQTVHTHKIHTDTNTKLFTNVFLYTHCINMNSSYYICMSFPPPPSSPSSSSPHLQDAYEELVMTVGSRRSSLNQNMALKGQYERALQDLADLVDTAQDKMAGDQRVIASSVEEVQILLDKHKVDFNLP
jgi:hypothetical protein